MSTSYPQKVVVRFGEFELDPSGELRSGGRKIKLQEQPLQILRILMEQPGEIVTREELRKKIWPSDTFVDFDHGINNAIKRLREVLGDIAETPRYIETLPRRGYRFVERVESKEGSIQSLAVLPLENLSRDPEQEYFVDGLTEALITSLAKISALRVISRTTAMQYKGVRNQSAREIARELGVDAIVEGTVLRSGDRVRISAQLINASTDMHMWAESYDRDLRDILALHLEVARAIAKEIQVTLTPQERVQLAKTRLVNPGAYEAYLKGRYYWNKRSPQAVKKCGDYLQAAVEKDPTYVAAYAGLADCAGVAGFWGFVSPELGCGRAKALAQRALEIDETAEAHASLGWAITHYDFDFFAAEKEFQRAIDLNPNYATVHQWHGHWLGYQGRLDQFLEAAARALQLDPLSLIINTTYAAVFWVGRQWDRAIEHCHRALELDPNFMALRWMLANAYEGKEMHEQAILERKWAVENSDGAPTFVAELVGSYAAAGKRDEALRGLEQLNELSKHHYVAAYWLALIHACLKDKEQAFLWLQKAYKERSARFALMKVDPRLDCLRSDPRFDDLLRRMNFTA